MQIDSAILLNSWISEPKRTDDAGKIRDAASQFEALLIKQMLQSARPDDGDEDQNSTLMDLGEQQFSQALASRGGLGIAKMVVAGLNKNADR